MTADSEFGTIERRHGHATLTFRRSLRHQPEKVWRALTENEHMESWMPCEMIGERAPGATVNMVFWSDLVAKTGLDPDAGTATITEWTPLQVFEWAWNGSTIRFEITPTTDGCVLDLSVDIQTDDPDTIIDNAGGYHLWMQHLTTLLDDGETPSIADAAPQSLENEYRRLLDTR